MIKMFIANEEVVSQNEFTINEEMLSASSSILNNCYPKSWEETKDYVNNFYYPKDYSKFLLENGNFLHGDTQYSIIEVVGTNPNYETNIEKELASLEIKGKTEQYSTPTYNVPSDLISVGVYNDETEKYNIEVTITNGANSNTFIYSLNEPLRSIEDISDLLYIQNGHLYIERKIGNVVLDGSEGNWYANRPSSWASRTHRFANLFLQDLIIKPLNDDETAKVLCNYFIPTTYNENIEKTNGITVSTNGVLYIYDESIETISASNFKAWLSTNKPNIQYALQTPIIEDLGEINIPSSYVGQNNTLFNTGVSTIEKIKYYWKNYDILFAGIVKNTGDISLNPRHPHYCSLQILDYKTFLSESDTLDFVISNKTIYEAIEMVVSTVADYGFVVGNIDIESANDIIGAYSTLNKTAYDVLQYLANISNCKWRCRYVDEDTMAIDFYDPDTLPQGANINYTQEYWEDNNIVDLTFNYGTRDYRNKQIMLSNEVYGGIDYTEILLSNGYDKSFITQQNVGVVKSVNVNGEEKEVVSQQDKDLGVDGDFYYTPGKNVVESAISYTAGTQIKITYIPLVKGRQIVYNNEEVNRIANQTNTSGIISRYENRNDIISSEELEQIGETYIEYKGKSEIILKLTTQNKNLYNIGEVVYFDAPIDELKQKYMVKAKKIEYEAINSVINIFYTYELSSSFNSEKAINYFDNQRNKASGNIQEGESITRNIDISNSALIVWGNSTIEEVSVSIDGDNTLNSVLNSPFIN